MTWMCFYFGEIRGGTSWLGFLSVKASDRPHRHLPSATSLTMSPRLAIGTLRVAGAPYHSVGTTKAPTGQARTPQALDAATVIACSTTPRPIKGEWKTAGRSERPAGESDRLSPTETHEALLVRAEDETNEHANLSPWANLPAETNRVIWSPTVRLARDDRFRSIFRFGRLQTRKRGKQNSIVEERMESRDPERSRRQHCPFERLAHLVHVEQTARAQMTNSWRAP